MRTFYLLLSAVVLTISASFLTASKPLPENSWSIDASYIEACSCELFCACYFNTHPDKDFCKFNNAINIEHAHYGKTKLDGMKVWMSGDLGGDFSKGEVKSVVYTFEPFATAEQIEAAKNIFAHVYPAKFGSITVATERLPITWKKDATHATAQLGDGKTASVDLDIVKGANGKTPVVVKNLKYWGADKNDGFTLAHSKHHYKGYGLDYTFDGANGFLIDIESSGKIE